MNPPSIRFQLYVAGQSPNSRVAHQNLTALCQEISFHGAEIEIVDVFEEPERALRENVLLTPLLKIITDGTTRVVVGNLSNTGYVREALDTGGVSA